jgi:nicotinate-nucleotide adenylyltransferase
MEFLTRASGKPARLGVFPATFNPPTRAHQALVRSALARVDEVLLVLPRVFPHKQFDGATFEQRCEMMRALAMAEARTSAAVSEGGLFVEIARECRAVYSSAELIFLCGRDAAERIIHWPHEASIERVLEEFAILVAARGGEYQPPAHLEGRVQALPLDCDYSEISATELRRRIRDRANWEELAPPELTELIGRFYS